MATADIKDRKSCEAWLTGKPRELYVLMAARAALRVLPLFSRFAEKTKNRRQYRDLTTSLFRAISLARSVGINSTHANGFAEGAAYAAAGASYTATYARAGFSAIAVASVAAFAGDATANADAVASAVNAADAADRIRDAAGYAAVRKDAGIYELRGMPALFGARLWPDGRPIWADEEWSELQTNLPKGEDWQVWTDWYEDRLNGIS